MFGRKRAGKEQQKESSKKQKVEEEKESEEVDEVDEAELKKLLVIKKDEDIAIDAIPLATKLPVIIDYKLHKEGMLVHYQLIRADGSSKRYSSMIRMLQELGKEDLSSWRIVKAKVTIWKLIDSSGVHFVRNGTLFLKCIKDGPFKQKTTEGDDKPESQWTPDERRVVVQDQRLKSIIMSCLPYDIMELVINCEIAKARWSDLVHNFKGPSDTKENRIMELKLEYQTLRAKPTESLSQTYTRYKTLLNELANDGVIPL
ncbi:hypothetical protein Tco_0639697 [Tanacetum coccineum]